ncbi:MAG: type IV pilin N-terminal domain-containing protein [Methanolinea sp.]|nr:type IV pilin N-terminal domain-containing protein [Methanolinea sp.]
MNTRFEHENAVSEILGALLLIAVISLAVSIIGVSILSHVNTSSVPAVSFVITNQSATITVLHGGGDTLPAGSYRILIDGSDRTGEFEPLPSDTPFIPGTALTYQGLSFPRTIMVLYRGPDGRETLLVEKIFSW